MIVPTSLSRVLKRQPLTPPRPQTGLVRPPDATAANVRPPAPAAPAATRPAPSMVKPPAAPAAPQAPAAGPGITRAGPLTPIPSPVGQRPPGITPRAPTPPVLSRPNAAPSNQTPGAQPPLPQAPPGTALDRINPAASLRGAAITPEASNRFTALQGAADQAAGRVSGINRGAEVDATRGRYSSEFNPRDLAAGAAVLPGQDPRLDAARARTDAAVGGAMGAAGDRFAIGDERAGAAARFLGPTDVRGPGQVALPDYAGAGTGVDLPGARTSAGPFRAGPTDVRFDSPGTDVNFRSAGTDVDFQGGPNRIQGGPAIGADVTDRERASYGRLDSSLDDLGEIDRVGQVRSLFDAFQRENAEETGEAIRGAGQSAARLGRLGMGGTARDIREIERRSQGDLQNTLARLVADATSGSIEDRFRLADVFSGQRGQEEASAAARRGEGRIERDYSTGIERENVGMGREDAASRMALAERNLGRGREDAMTRLGVDEANLGRARDDAQTRLGVSERNLGRTREDVASAREMGERDLERERQERDLGYAARVGDTERALGEAARRTAFGENQYGRARSAELDRYEADVGNVERGLDARRTALGFGADQAGAAVGDRFAAADLARGAEGDVYGQGAAERGERREERGYQDDVSRFNLGQDIEGQRFAAGYANDVVGAGIGDRFNVMDALRQREGDIFGQESQLRDETRGERGYQDYLAEGAQRNRISQYEAEERARAGDFGRSMDRFNAGYSGSPSELEAMIGSEYGQSANQNFGAMADIIRQSMLANAMRGQQTQPGLDPYAMILQGMGGARGY